MIDMKPTEDTKLWEKKTYDPYFSLIASGRVKFEDRITQEDFPVKTGDWIVFKLYDETTRQRIGQRQLVKAVDFVRNTKEVPFWLKEHSEFPGITIMQLVDSTCPTCNHRLDFIWDFDHYEDSLHAGYDTSYFQCVPTEDCGCDCNLEIEDNFGLVYEN